MTTTVPPPATSEAPPERAQAIGKLIDTLQLPHRRLTPAELEQTALAVAAHPELYLDLVVDSPARRWWLVLHHAGSFEVRLLSWEFDQSSGWHDHGGSSGGWVVTDGVLVEKSRAGDEVGVETHRFAAGAHGGFGAAHLHDVFHEKGRPAVSIHAYSPPLTNLTMYDLTPFGFVVREVVPDDQRAG